MPKIQGVSKAQANYRSSDEPSIRCGECRYMWPKLAVGGCRYVRGVIRPGDVCDLFAPSAPRPQG